MPVEMTGNKVTLDELFDKEFIVLMSKIEKNYKLNTDTVLTPAEGFMLDGSVSMLMGIIHENAALIAYLQKEGLLTFEEAPEQ